LIAALAIYQFHWQRADGLVGLAIAGLIWAGATPLVLASIRELKSTQLQDARVPENKV
jgi:Co/Zn/Cd efflux system component